MRNAASGGSRTGGIAVACLYLFFAWAAPAQVYTTFDAPGAGTGSGQGTFALRINAEGAIAGYYYEANGAVHGFVRDPGGSLTSFDPHGAADTVPTGINTAGAIAGSYADASSEIHSFVRAPDGTIITFEIPGAGTGVGQGTYAASINAAGDVTGYSVPVSDSRVEHQRGGRHYGILLRFEKCAARLRARHQWHDNHLQCSGRGNYQHPGDLCRRHQRRGRYRGILL